MTTAILNKIKFLQQQKQSTKFWNITWDQGVFLSSLIEIKKPKRVLEIGTSNGFSTLWIAKDLPEGFSIDTIEVNEARFEYAKRNFESCELKNVNQHLGEVFEVLPKLSGKFDFVFIDAAHQFYKDLLVKVEELNLLDDDYMIVFDNVSTHKHLNVFLEFVEKNYFCEHLDMGGGFLIVKKK